MPTVKCECGEPIHYSVDKIGLIARCRCGRPVRLPEQVRVRSVKRHRSRLTMRELLAKLQHAAYVHRQLLAMIFAVVAIGVIAFAMIRSSANSAAPRPTGKQATSP